MSETSRTAETAKRAADHTIRSSQAAMEAAGKATKDAIHEANDAAQNGAERTKEVAHTLTETVTETASVAADLSSRAAEQGREVLLMGVRTAAGVGSRVADIGYGRSHHLLASATHAMDIYRDASERSAERVQALFSSYLTFGRGLRSMQHAWLEPADQSLENAAQKPQDLLRCKNVV